mgnify:CR=1 FL=1
MRNRAGQRRHRLDAKQHDGTLDGHGDPTYTVPGDWDTVVTGWPCEMLTVSAGERVRGRQVTDQTTVVFFGEFQGGSTITPDMRVEVNSVTYEVVTAFDPENTRREYRVEAKLESD